MGCSEGSGAVVSVLDDLAGSALYITILVWLDSSLFPLLRVIAGAEGLGFVSIDARSRALGMQMRHTAIAHLHRPKYIVLGVSVFR